ncbi:MAG: D-alanyl-D-alanine carboxypeptidase [Deltaproteobacteria bacterium]|nr:D-alanyl-D-alanine carboxypeptidase [Deltaproteobacteria bacterium]
MLPEIKSKAAFILDAATGAEIFGKEADVARPIASTTKIFVAMVVRKRKLDLDAWTPITKVDASYARGGARTRLDVGDAFRNRDLLRAMLIASDNRAPTALGRAVGLDPDQLIAAMNKVAKDLKLARTRFTDPSGLRGNVSTARELAIALRVALEDDVLAEIMKTDHVRVVSKNGDRIDYTNTNQPLLAQRYDVRGGKTGYTDAAGYCFVAAARFDSHDVVMAFLGAEEKLTRWGDFNRAAHWLDLGAPRPAAAAPVAPAKKKRTKRPVDDE